MSTSILEALENADYNFRQGLIGIPLAKSQLHNAVILLRKGYSLYDEVDLILDKYDDVECVPDKE